MAVALPDILLGAGVGNDVMLAMPVGCDPFTLVATTIDTKKIPWYSYQSSIGAT